MRWHSWFVIPAMGVVSALVALGLGQLPFDPIAVGLCGAALAAFVRSLVGESPSALAAAVIAPLLAVALVADRAVHMAVPCLAIGGAAWTVVELKRTTTSPIVAMLPALVAGIAHPSFMLLVPIAGWRLVTAPWQRPRWIVAVPIVGGIATLVAVIAAFAHGGALRSLGDAWFGARDPIGPAQLASSIAYASGPLVALAALGGIYVFVEVAPVQRLARLAVGCILVCTLLADLRGGGASAVTLGFVATSAGLAIGRLAATIRFAPGQAIVAATLGLVVVLPQAWILIERAVT